MKKIIYILFIILFVCCKKDTKTNAESTGTPADFLTENYYDRLLVEVVYVTGMRPTSETMNNLANFLQERLHKSAGIDILYREVASPGKTILSADDIRTLESTHRKHLNSENTLTAFILFVDGEYSGSQGNSKVLGIAYGGSSMAIFEKTIREYSGGLTQPSTTLVESSVTNHEFGHVLGLVNNGTPLSTSHQDEAHGKHCDNNLWPIVALIL